MHASSDTGDILRPYRDEHDDEVEEVLKSIRAPRQLRARNTGDCGPRALARNTAGPPYEQDAGPSSSAIPSSSQSRASTRRGGTTSSAGGSEPQAATNDTVGYPGDPTHKQDTSSAIASSSSQSKPKRARTSTRRTNKGLELAQG